MVANGSLAARRGDGQILAARLAQVDHDQRAPRCASRVQALRDSPRPVGVFQVGHPGVAAQIGEEIDLLARQARIVGRLQDLFDLDQRGRQIGAAVRQLEVVDLVEEIAAARRPACPRSRAAARPSAPA